MDKSMQVSCVLMMLVGFAFFLISYCTDHWISPRLLVNSTGGIIEPHQGLWLMCNENNTCTHITPVTAFLRAVQVIETAGLLSIIVTFVAAFVGLADHAIKYVIMQAILNACSGVFIWLGIFIYRGHYSEEQFDNAGFSLFFGVISGTIFFVTCILNGMDYKRIVREKEDR